MERLNIKEYNKIHNRFGFFLSLPTVILVFFHYQFIVPLIRDSELALNYLVVFSFIFVNAILGLFVVNQLVKPVKMHVFDPTNKQIELKAYKNISILPNYALVYLPIVIAFIWSLSSMSFQNNDDQLHAMILELSFLAILTGILYLFANHRITFSLQFFSYQPGFMNISMKKRIGIATFISILGILVNGIYAFYLTRDNLGSSMSVGIYTLFVLIPCIIFLTNTIIKSTIGPVTRILTAWDLMEQNGQVNLPNMCVGEMADLTYRFEHAMQQVQNQLKENTELSQELSGVANDLSTSADVVSSTAENIASSQQYIAKGAAQQTGAILRIQQKINAVAQGVAITQEKVSHISNISNSIKSIAGQTNILALNAAIEAARAGEAGRGFNVVADQVRKLADESKRAVSNTDSMIKEIETVAGNQKQIMTDLLHEIGELSTIAEETSSSTEEVSASAEEQSASMQQISGSANRIANLASMLIRLKSVTVENVVDEPQNIPKVMHITPSDIKNSKVTPKVVLPIESLYNGKSA